MNRFDSHPKGKFKPLTLKQMGEPTVYDGTQTKFTDWRDLLHSYLGSHDMNFVHLLLWLEDLGRRPMKPQDMIDLADDLDLTNSDL